MPRLFAVVFLALVAFVGCGETSSGSRDPDPVDGTNSGGALARGGGTNSVGGNGATAGSISGSSGGGSDTSSAAGSPTLAGAANAGAASIVAGAPNTDVVIALNESAITLDTPDLTHSLVATVSGAGNSAVTWTSSNAYVAKVNAAGVVTSVSGGQATITATAVADATKTATALVTVAEPNRKRAESYIDAKTITSGPINILMCGDSLMRTYAPNASDQTGWGQVLGQFFSTDVTVDNSLPNGGRSSRSFYNEAGRWILVRTRLAAAKAAGVPTFVFIMFGHNDQKKLTDTNGADYLTFASQNPNGTVAGTYFDYLERYIVETRELGGIPVLFTPFVREYLEGAPASVTAAGRHDITVPYAGEATARGDYPAAMKAVAAKHDVPVIDITSFSKLMVEARAAAGTLDFVYLSSDQTHVRNLGALLIADEAVRALNAQGILTNYSKKPAARVMLDASTLAFGGLYSGTSLDKTIRISPYGDVSGSITLAAPPGYSISTDGTSFDTAATIASDSSYVGSIVTVRFAPADPGAYNADLTVSHSSVVVDYGNVVPNSTVGHVSLTGNGKVAISGSPAVATWPLFVGTSIVLTPSVTGAIGALPATLSGLVNKNVLNGAARFDTPDGVWSAEGARNPARYLEFALPVTTGTFTIDSISVDAGSAGGSNMRWDIVYSLTQDFVAPTALGTALYGAKDTLVSSSYPSLGVDVTAGQTLYLRVYPYNTSATTGKSIMVANVVVSGVTN